MCCEIVLLTALFLDFLYFMVFTSTLISGICTYQYFNHRINDVVDHFLDT